MIPLLSDPTWPAPLMALAAIAAMTRALLGLVFLQALGAKLAARDRLAGTIADYRLLPGWMARPAAWLLPLAEALAAALLLAALAVPALAVPGACLAGALLALFASAMAINLHRGRSHISCGCHAAPTPLSWRGVAAAASLACLALPASVPLAPASLPVSLCALAGGLMLWTMSHTATLLLQPRRATAS